MDSKTFDIDKDLLRFKDCIYFLKETSCLNRYEDSYIPNITIRADYYKFLC